MRPWYKFWSNAVVGSIIGIVVGGLMLGTVYLGKATEKYTPTHLVKGANLYAIDHGDVSSLEWTYQGFMYRVVVTESKWGAPLLRYDETVDEAGALEYGTVQLDGCYECIEQTCRVWPCSKFTGVEQPLNADVENIEIDREARHEVLYSQ